MKILLECAMGWLRCATVIAFGVAGFASVACAQESHVGKLTGHAANGGDDFRRYCAGCHGTRGDGKGTFAPYLDPRPRDMTAGIFKCRSTPTGTLPTDQDIYDTLIRGIVTTAMPSWAPLTPQARVDMVAYVKKFSPRFVSEKLQPPVEIPPEGAVTLAGLRHGEDLFQKAGCVNCHGREGHGDGPAAASLLDIKGRPDPPYDFTETGRFKCGSTNASLYRTLMTGMDGSPMASFHGRLTPEETWDVVHYVRALQVGRKGPENKVWKAAGGGVSPGDVTPAAPAAAPYAP